MLTVAKVTADAAGGYADYLDGRSQPDELGDYYLKDGERVEAPGRWVSGASAVGSDAGTAVSGGELRVLMAVRRPDTGQPLRRVGGNGKAVAAIDATFSAPKSVSAVWALARPGLRERIELSHEQAIDRALAYAVGQVPMIRQRVDAETVIRAKPPSVVATSWRHTTARAVDGQPPDPQLHSHLLLHGAIRDDGRIVAIESRAWFVHRRELGAAYRTELARELADLGFGIQRGTGRAGRYFELQGVPARLIDRWSSRHHEVRAAIESRLMEKEDALEAQAAAGGEEGRDAEQRLEELRRSRQLTPAEDRFAAQSSRAAKPRLATHGDLDRHWWHTARAHEFDARSVEGLRDRRSRTLGVAPDAELLGGLVEFDATFADREARAVVLEASAGASIEQSLAALRLLRATREVLALADGRATTRIHRAAERRTVALAEKLAGGRAQEISPATVEREAVVLDRELRRRGGELAAEQRHALVLACSDRRLVMVEGQAGTGKSTVLAAVARAHEAEGRGVVVTSTSALAAERLANELRGAGVTPSSYSTAALHAAIETGQLELGATTTVIHDEGALASTREQRQLLAAVEESGARLIEVGDPKQSHAVGAGGLWPHLEKAARANQAHAELTQNVRTHDAADRRDQKLFRAGQHEQAIEGYQDRGRLTVAEDPLRAEDAALEAAHRDRLEGKRTLVIAQTSNDHLDELNLRAQAIRAQHGELGTELEGVPGRPYGLHPGDEIQIRHSIEHVELGHLRNGTTGVVVGIDQPGRLLSLRLQDGRNAELSVSQVEQADLRLAYVQHPFPAQGQTTDTAHLIVAEHATEEGCYVSITRAREATEIYTSSDATDTGLGEVAALAARMSRTEPEVPSIETPLAYEAVVGREAEVEQRTSSTMKLLGPRPAVEDPNHARWERAAAVIDEYRSKYGIERSAPGVLGPEPEAGHFSQRYDRHQVIEEALEVSRAAGLEDERIFDVLGFTAQEQERDGGVGWEP